MSAPANRALAHAAAACYKKISSFTLAVHVAAFYLLGNSRSKFNRY